MNSYSILNFNNKKEMLSIIRKEKYLPKENNLVVITYKNKKVVGIGQNVSGYLKKFKYINLPLEIKNLVKEETFAVFLKMLPRKRGNFVEIRYMDEKGILYALRTPEERYLHILKISPPYLQNLIEQMNKNIENEELIKHLLSSIIPKEISRLINNSQINYFYIPSIPLSFTSPLDLLPFEKLIKGYKRWIHIIRGDIRYRTLPHKPISEKLYEWDLSIIVGEEKKEFMEEMESIASIFENVQVLVEPDIKDLIKILPRTRYLHIIGHLDEKGIKISKNTILSTEQLSSLAFTPYMVFFNTCGSMEKGVFSKIFMEKGTKYVIKSIQSIQETYLLKLLPNKFYQFLKVVKNIPTAWKLTTLALHLEKNDIWEQYRLYQSVFLGTTRFL